MNVEINKKPKSTIEIKVVVPNDKVKQTYDGLFKEVVKNAEISGFRKGQAPEDKVKEKMDTSKIYGEVINTLLQTYYPQALKENHIQPVANPKVEITQFDLEKDFEFVATVAVRPEVKLGDYVAQAKKTLEARTKQLRETNAEKLKQGDKIEVDHAHLHPEDVINAIVDVTEAEIADMLVEDEADRMVSRLVDQAQAVGLSLDQYLKAQNKTAEQLRDDYKKIAERNLKAEFALSELIQKEKIEVTDQEIEITAAASGDPQAIESLKDPMQRWYVKSILQKNKLVAKILEEIEGPVHDHSQDRTNSTADNGDATDAKEE
jgi:FKBP-type peptidyl-prolyl cis-trans isomerase (trigger factor)